MKAIKLPHGNDILILLEQVSTMDDKAAARALAQCNLAQVEAAGATAMFDAVMEALNSDNPQDAIQRLHSDLCRHIEDMEALEKAMIERLPPDVENLIKPYAEDGEDLTKLDIENSQNLTKPDIGNLKKLESENSGLLKNVETQSRYTAIPYTQDLIMFPQLAELIEKAKTADAEELFYLQCDNNVAVGEYKTANAIMMALIECHYGEGIGIEQIIKELEKAVISHCEAVDQLTDAIIKRKRQILPIMVNTTGAKQ